MFCTCMLCRARSGLRSLCAQHGPYTGVYNKIDDEQWFTTYSCLVRLFNFQNVLKLVGFGFVVSKLSWNVIGRGGMRRDHRHCVDMRCLWRRITVLAIHY